jgi:putative oxidoreductase
LPRIPDLTEIMPMNTSISSAVKGLHLNLDRAGSWLAPLTLRLFIAWEFFESGLEKWNGENWFADIQDRFPFPFDQLPATLNWELSMWVELIGALAILAGLGTRISAISLMVVTVVATAAVHWPADWSTLSELAQGYAISNKGHGNFKLPLIYLAALMPLLLSGAGKLSLDTLLARFFWRRHNR